VQGKKNFERVVQTFAASLLPFGVSFAALWRKFCRLTPRVLPLYALVASTNKQSEVQKSVAFSRGGEGGVEVSPRTAYCC